MFFPNHTINKVVYLESEEDTQLKKNLKEQCRKLNLSPTIQKAIVAAFGKRSIRLDVYLDNGETIYDVEMQASVDKFLAKRSRMYMAQIDVNQLRRGESYDKLKPAYVIFVCTYDPFGKNQYQYTFRASCKEEDLLLDDESYRIFLNTKGKKGDISPKLKEVLEYMNNPEKFSVEKTENELIRKIDRAVATAQHDKEWRDGYMVISTIQREAELRGEAQGIKKGQARLARLIDILYKEGKGNLVPSLVTDPQKTEEYFKLYKLS